MFVDIFLILFGAAILISYVMINLGRIYMMELERDIKKLQKLVAYLEKERDYMHKSFDEIKKEVKDSKAGKVYLKKHSKYEEDYYGPTSYGS